MIRLFWSILFAVNVPITFWLGGADLTVRTPNTAIAYGLFLSVVLFAEAYPGKYPGEKK